MTQEELLQKIATLEAENSYLKSKYEKHSYRKRVPDNYHGGELGLHRELSLDENDIQVISSAVRKACFDLNAKEITRYNKYYEKKVKRKEYRAIPLNKFSNEQYERYCQIICNVFDIFFENRKEENK